MAESDPSLAIRVVADWTEYDASFRARADQASRGVGVGGGGGATFAGERPGGPAAGLLPPPPAVGPFGYTFGAPPAAGSGVFSAPFGGGPSAFGFAGGGAGSFSAGPAVTQAAQQAAAAASATVAQAAAQAAQATAAQVVGGVGGKGPPILNYATPAGFTGGSPGLAAIGGAGASGGRRGSLVPMGLYFQVMFGGMEISHAVRAGHESDVRALTADTFDQSLAARAAGLRQQTSGMLGGIAGALTGASGTIEDLETQAYLWRSGRQMADRMAGVRSSSAVRTAFFSGRAFGQQREEIVQHAAEQRRQLAAESAELTQLTTLGPGQHQLSAAEYSIFQQRRAQLGQIPARVQAVAQQEAFDLARLQERRDDTLYSFRADADQNAIRGQYGTGLTADLFGRASAGLGAFRRARNDPEQQSAILRSVVSGIYADVAEAGRSAGRENRADAAQAAIDGIRAEGDHRAASFALAGDRRQERLTEARTARDVELSRLDRERAVALEEAGQRFGFLGRIWRGPDINNRYNAGRLRAEQSEADRERLINQEEDDRRTLRLGGLSDRVRVTGEEAAGREKSARSLGIELEAERAVSVLRGPDAAQERRDTLQAALNELQAYQRQLQFRGLQGQGLAQASGVPVGPGFQQQRPWEQDVASALKDNKSAIERLTDAINKDAAARAAANGDSGFDAGGSDF